MRTKSLMSIISLHDCAAVLCSKMPLVFVVSLLIHNHFWKYSPPFTLELCQLKFLSLPFLSLSLCPASIYLSSFLCLWRFRVIWSHSSLSASPSALTTFILVSISFFALESGLRWSNPISLFRGVRLFRKLHGLLLEMGIYTFFSSFTCQTANHRVLAGSGLASNSKPSMKSTNIRGKREKPVSHKS